MNEEKTESSQLTLGQTLKNSREDANVSLKTLSENLKLPVPKLQHLENDEHDLLGPPTFIKGYVKSYCREFNLDTKHVLSLYSEPAAPVTKGNMQSFSKRTEKEANDSRLMFVSYVILAVIIGSSALWWWQNSTPINDSVVHSTINELIPVEVNSQGKVDQPSSLNDESEQQRLIQDQQNMANEVAPQTDTPVSQSTLGTTDSSTTDSATETITQPTQSSTNTPTQTDQQGAETSTIVMSFDEDSWVEVHDGEGERIAFGLKKQGYTMTVEGLPPFSVVLGKHQVVDVSLNGETVDLTGFPENRLAKFTLPLAE